jgi:hypothetical protein
MYGQDQQQTRPYGNTGRVFLHQFKHGSGGRVPVIFAAVVALAALAVSTASITLLLQYRGTAQAQIGQLQRAVASAQAASRGRASASQVDGLAGKVSTISGALNALAQFNTVCSQYLTGPSGGPTTFYFACTQTKP